MRTPHISVAFIGREREPVVTIDDFAHDPASLCLAASAASFSAIGPHYPGVRAPVSAAYFAQVGPTITAIGREYFDYRQDARVDRSYYSLMTTAPGDLSLAQRVPHCDAYEDARLAIVHYLCPERFGGTGFFRHRSTGYESVNDVRAERFRHSLAADFAAKGEPAADYIDADSALFERIHLVEARFNRAVIYRGKLLHCATLAQDMVHTADPLEGRLTIASFLSQ